MFPESFNILALNASDESVLCKYILHICTQKLFSRQIFGFKFSRDIYKKNYLQQKFTAQLLAENLIIVAYRLNVTSLNVMPMPRI